MDGPAWSTFHAIAMAGEAAIARRSVDADDIAAHLREPGRTFEVGKGEGARFVLPEQQLIHPLFVSRIIGDSSARRRLSQQMDWAELVDKVTLEGVVSVPGSPTED